MNSAIIKEDSLYRFELLLKKHNIEIDEIPKKINKKLLLENGMKYETYKAKGSPFRVVNAIYPDKFDKHDFLQSGGKGVPRKWNDEEISNHFNDCCSQYLDNSKKDIFNLNELDIATILKTGHLPYIKNCLKYDFSEIIKLKYPHIEANDVFKYKGRRKKKSTVKKSTPKPIPKPKSSDSLIIETFLKAIEEKNLNSAEGINNNEDLINFFSARNIKNLCEKEGLIMNLNSFDTMNLVFPNEITFDEYIKVRRRNKKARESNTWTDEYIIKIISEIVAENNLSRDDLPKFFTTEYLRHNNLYTPVLLKGGIYNLINLVFPNMYTKEDFESLTRKPFWLERWTDNEIKIQVKNFINELNINEDDIPLVMDSALLKDSSLMYIFKGRFNSDFFKLINFVYPDRFKKELFIGATKYRKEFFACNNLIDAMHVTLKTGLPVPKVFYCKLSKSELLDYIQEVHIKEIGEELSLFNINNLKDCEISTDLMPLFKPILRHFSYNGQMETMLRKLIYESLVQEENLDMKSIVDHIFEGKIEGFPRNYWKDKTEDEILECLDYVLKIEGKKDVSTILLRNYRINEPYRKLWNSDIKSLKESLDSYKNKKYKKND